MVIGRGGKRKRRTEKGGGQDSEDICALDVAEAAV